MGLMFIMFILERKERQAAEHERQEATERANSLEALNTEVIKVVKENTRAITELSEEVRHLNGRSEIRETRR